MNRKGLSIILFALGLTAGCGGSGSHSIIEVSISQPPPGIIAPNNSASIAATITGTKTGVTWSCTPGNTATSCGSFNPSTTLSGVTTVYTAPPTAVGSVAITATSVKDGTPSAPANVQISTSGGLSGNYSFYLSGFDGNNKNGIYSLAGAVSIAVDGTLTGEEDYNDAGGITLPDVPISSGSLSFSPTTGLGSLTLVTGNNSLGVNGTQTLALNFVNNSHALIIQADASATASGSFDLQNLASTPAGGFSFVLSGAGNTGNSDFFGGVFTVSGSSVSNGMYDQNIAGSIGMGKTFATATLSQPADGFGRGTLTGTGIGNTIAYYIVGPEVIRLIDVDGSRTLVGSAFGQGASAGNFGNGSVGNSVFSVQSNLAGIPFGAIGQIVPSGTNFSGVADVNEPDPGVGFADAQTISGTYSIATNGYGSLNITSATLGPVSVLGIYATDPTLNLNDPNNTTSPGPGSILAGAVVVDLDTDVAGSGVLVPQTDTATTSFAGNYALGLQDLVPDTGEFDFAGNATAATGSLSGAGILNDPADVLQTTEPLVNSGTSFTSTLVSDGLAQGRYLLDPINVIVGDGAATITYQAIVYQANGGQLLWMENGADGNDSVFTGLIQQQTLPLGAAARKAAVKKTQK
jgi:hypothetical protein